MNIKMPEPEPTYDPKILHEFDFSAIEKLDPQLQDGFKVFHACSFPCCIIMSDEEEHMQTMTSLDLRLMLKHEANTLKEIKLELTSQDDMFFCFIHQSD